MIRVQLDDSQDPECGMGGVIDLLGARVTPDGKVPILETRHCFYYPKEVSVVRRGFVWRGTTWLRLSPRLQLYVT